MDSAPQIILIVDYDQPTLELYQRELSREYTILTCDRVAKALELLRTQPVAAVVFEPFLHEKQDWSLLTAVKKLPGAARIPVVLCSTLDERLRGMEMGAAAYLVKPVLPATLLDTLRQVTRRK